MPGKKTRQLLPSLHRLLPCSSPARGRLKFPPLSLVRFRQCPPFIGCPGKTRQLLSLHCSLPSSHQREVNWNSLLSHWSFTASIHLSLDARKKPATTYYTYISRFLAPHQREVDTLLSHWSFSASVHLSLDARKKTRQLLSLHRSLPCFPPARGRYPPLSLVLSRQCPPFIGCKKISAKIYIFEGGFL